MWIGHVAMTVTDPQRSHDFYVSVGMRPVFIGPDVAITELRGGTHLVLLPGAVTAGPAPFDLMVDDLAATHNRLQSLGCEVTSIVPGDIHATFVLTDPDGISVRFSDSHVVGTV